MSLDAISVNRLIEKYKGAGLPDELICKRLGITSEELNQRWGQILKDARTKEVSGYGELILQFNLLCQQYQVLGESLKVIAMTLGNCMSPAEIRELIKPNPEETLDNLVQKCIVLRPFHAPDMEKMITELAGATLHKSN